MIYTYPADHPSAPETAIFVDSAQPFDLDEAVWILDQSRSGDVALQYPAGTWWTQPVIGKLCDFLGYRGVNIIHSMGEFVTPHSAYLASRLEKLYNDDILDNWAQV